MSTLIISGDLPSLNEYTKANRSKYGEVLGARVKREAEKLIRLHIQAQGLTDIHYVHPVRIDFRWYMENARKDPDNVCFAKKFILDALVRAGVLENDNYRHVKGFTDNFFIDKDFPRIEIDITPEYLWNQKEGEAGDQEQI